MVALNEAGCVMVHREMPDQQEGQGGAPETSWQDVAAEYPYVEVGGHYYGFHHEASQD